MSFFSRNKKPKSFLSRLFDGLSSIFFPEVKSKRKRRESEENRALLLQTVGLLCVLLVVLPSWKLPFEVASSIVGSVLLTPGDFSLFFKDDNAVYNCNHGEDITKYLHRITFYRTGAFGNYLQCEDDANVNCQKVKVQSADCINLNQGRSNEDTPQWKCEFNFKPYDTYRHANLVPVLSNRGVICSNADGVTAYGAQQGKKSTFERARQKGKEVCTPCSLFYNVEFQEDTPFFPSFGVDSIFNSLNYMSLGVFGKIGPLLYFLFFSSMVISVLGAMMYVVFRCCGIITTRGKGRNNNWWKKSTTKYTSFIFGRRKGKDSDDDSDSEHDSDEEEPATISKGVINLSNRLYTFMRNYILPFTVSRGTDGSDSEEEEEESDSDHDYRKKRRRSRRLKGMKPIKLKKVEMDSDDSEYVNSSESSDSD